MGGVRSEKEKVRSGRMVMRHGVGEPGTRWEVSALNSWGLGIVRGRRGEVTFDEEKCKA